MTGWEGIGEACYWGNGAAGGKWFDLTLVLALPG